MSIIFFCWKRHFSNVQPCKWWSSLYWTIIPMFFNFLLVFTLPLLLTICSGNWVVLYTTIILIIEICLLKGDQRFLYCQTQLLSPWSFQRFLEIFPFVFGDTTYAIWVLLFFSSQILILSLLISLHLGFCSQVVFSWCVPSLALSFTLVVLTWAF